VLTKTNLTEADIQQAVFTGAVDLSSARGLDASVNKESAVFDSD
jgi:uncharacterized protein YjbI with pentapeptide repeats